MEIEELQKVWNEQKGENMYTINEESLRKIITRKKDAAARRVSKTEIGLILITVFLGAFITIKAIIKDEGLWDLGGGLVILATSLFVIIARYRRKKSEDKFDRSMIGEIEHAIANTQSIISITYSMLFWYMLPVGIFTYGQMIFTGVSMAKFLLITAMFVFAVFLIYWERKYCHVPRKEKLQKLKEKLKE